MIAMDYPQQDNQSQPPHGESFRVVYLPQNPHQQMQNQQAPSAHHQHPHQPRGYHEGGNLQNQPQRHQHPEIPQHPEVQQILQQQQLMANRGMQQPGMPQMGGQPHPGHLPPQFHPYQVQVLYLNQYSPYPTNQAPSGEGYWTYARATPSPPIVPHENDVLMGRGGKNNAHVGNEQLRQMARALREAYIKSTKKEKSALSRKLVKDVHELDPPGRFLRRNRITSVWETVDDEYAREKTSQCLRDAVTGGAIGEGTADDQSTAEDEDKSQEVDEGGTSRSSTPVPAAAGQKRDSPVITPEHSPESKRRQTKSLNVGDLKSLELDLKPAAKLSEAKLHNSFTSLQRSNRSISPRKASSYGDLTTLTRTAGSDSAAIDAWVELRGDAASYGASAIEPLAFQKAQMRGRDTHPRRDIRKAATSSSMPPLRNPVSGIANRPNENCLDLSGHSQFSESNFALFGGDLLREENQHEQHGDAEPPANFANLRTVSDSFMARSDDPIDMKACGDAAVEGSQAAAEFTPMATEDEDSDLELQIDNDPTGQTEEIVMMLTDPFDTEFF